VAAALGVLCNVPHGLACAVMLPTALRANRDVAVAELAMLERAVSRGAVPPADDAEAADKFIDRIVQICWAVGIPNRLSALNVRAEQISALVAESRGNSMSGNPREIPDDELERLLEGML
jgi:alcohol dehydrogenase class IV